VADSNMPFCQELLMRKIILPWAFFGQREIIFVVNWNQIFKK
jgi:hypothetical protein